MSATTPILTPPHRSEAWVAAWRLALAAPLAIALYGEVAIGMVRDWLDQPDLSHGLLVPPLALYFAWRRRAETMAAPAAPHWAGLPLAAAGCAAYLAGRLGAELFLQRISLVVVLAGAVASCWGLARLRTLAFPVVLLAGMVPLPSLVYNWAAAPLQLFASDLATEAARLAGISVFRNGNIIHLAGTTLGVEEACSGLRSLMSLMVAALLIGQVHNARMRTRLLLFAAATPLAIFMNVVRVAGTAVLADFKESLAMGFYHSFSGWLVFVAGFAALLGTARILEPAPDRK